MIEAALWGGLAAASLIVGYYLATSGPSRRATGLIMGVGAGALVAAIAYELVPESVLGGWGMGLAFGTGAVAFFLGDWVVDRGGGKDRKDIAGSAESGSGAAIFVGTLLDNVPESIILGMGLALGGTINLAFLIAVFISNLPEGVAGSINLEAAGYPRKKISGMWALLVAVSAACAGLGYMVVSRLPEADGRIAQAFAAGAMLTMLADAMMPEAFQHGGKMVGLFTALGFLLAAVLSISA